MILDSVLVTSVLDLFYIAVTIIAIVSLVRYAQNSRAGNIGFEIRLLCAGLAIWTVFHAIDFIWLVIGPAFSSPESVAAFSERMHSDYRLFTDLAATGLLVVGFLRLLARFRALYSDMERDAADLADELGSNRENEDQLLASEQTQRAIAESKTDFLVSISHELRTPLNGIIGLGNLLANTELTKEQAKLLSTLEQSAQAMLTRVSDVLDLARLQSGQTDLRSVAFHPCDLATSVQALFTPFANKKGLSFETACLDNADRPVISDHLLIKQALTNIVSNAIKYTPTGHVKIETRVRSAGSERLWLEYVVEDTGVGMDDELLELLADPDKPVSEAEIGVGLAICWRVAKLLEGHIDVEAKPEGGMRVCLALQVQREPKPEDDHDS